MYKPYGAETTSSQGNGFACPIGYGDSTYYPEDNSASVVARTNKTYKFPITGSAKNLYITLGQWALGPSLKKWVHRVWLEE